MSVSDWIFVSILLTLFWAGLMRQSEGQQLTLLVRSVFNPALISSHLRQERSFGRLLFYTYVFIVLCHSLFLSISLWHFGITDDLSYPWIFLLVAGSIIGLTTLRTLLYASFAWLTHAEEVYHEHLYLWLRVNLFQSIWLLVVSVVISFAAVNNPTLLITLSIITAAIAYFTRAIRLFALLTHKYPHDKMYIFLYICALEILPALLIIKVVYGQLSI
ncbi:MAG: hypothetical protein Kow0075_13430 [Salibacteraceae bacterium]